MRSSTFLLVITAAMQLGATDCGSAIRDAGFDLWCGNELCVWKTVRGEVRRAPTWHEQDAGVELVGTDVAITQLSPVNSFDTQCIRFEMVANVAGDAEAFLEADIEDDGTIDFSERIPTSSWKPVSFLIPIDPPYDGVRFNLTKRGTGTAVLAQIRAETQTADECAGLTAIDPGPRPDGAHCYDASDCGSRLCLPSRTEVPSSGLPLSDACAGCDHTLGTSACNAGEVCGLANTSTSLLAIPSRCVPLAAKQIGEQCLSNDECGSGICHVGDAQWGSCSACDTMLAPCTGGATCADGWQGHPDRPPWLGYSAPQICAPRSRQGSPGDACTSSSDCASEVCAGTERNECRDGRPCISIADCPVEGALEPGTCSIVGIQGGRCE